MKQQNIQRTRVKICGITDVDTARYVANAGADAIGLVFYPPSPRSISIENAATIVASLPPFFSSVGLFVNPSKQEVESVLKSVPLTMLQFHGDEDEELCCSFNLPYLKAIRVKEDTDFKKTASQYSSAAGLLLDTYHKDNYGGTGECFDWRVIPQDLALPVVLAGGLSPDNVAEAISLVKPFAVDVSSGVELDRGIKNPEKITTFMLGVKEADVANKR